MPKTFSALNLVCRRVFCDEFNLSFHRPPSCSRCEVYLNAEHKSALETYRRQNWLGMRKLQIKPKLALMLQIMQ